MPKKNSEVEYIEDLLDDLDLVPGQRISTLLQRLEAEDEGEDDYEEDEDEDEDDYED